MSVTKTQIPKLSNAWAARYAALRAVRRVVDAVIEAYGPYDGAIARLRALQPDADLASVAKILGTVKRSESEPPALWRASLAASAAETADGGFFSVTPRYCLAVASPFAKDEELALLATQPPSLPSATGPFPHPALYFFALRQCSPSVRWVADRVVAQPEIGATDLVRGAAPKQRQQLAHILSVSVEALEGAAETAYTALDAEVRRGLLIFRLDVSDRRSALMDAEGVHVEAQREMDAADAAYKDAQQRNDVPAFLAATARRDSALATLTAANVAEGEAREAVALAERKLQAYLSALDAEAAAERRADWRAERNRVVELVVPTPLTPEQREMINVRDHALSAVRLAAMDLEKAQRALDLARSSLDNAQASRRYAWTDEEKEEADDWIAASETEVEMTETALSSARAAVEAAEADLANAEASLVA